MTSAEFLASPGVEAAEARILQDGYAVARLGASASVKDMEGVALQLMKISKDSAGGYNGMGGVTRKTIEDTLFVDSAAGAPCEVTIQFHHEMAYATAFPKYVTFAMIRQASEDGTTTLADSVKVRELMSKPLLDKFKTLGVQYIRYLHDEADKDAPDFYTSWQGAFVTESMDEAMRKGNSAEAFSTFQRHDERRWKQTLWCPVFVEHPQLGETWFGSVLNRHASWLDGHPYWDKVPPEERPYQCLWGDGTPFSEEELREIQQVHQDSTIYLRLDPGDVLVVDNLRVAHGRTPYRGSRLLGLLLSDMVPRRPCTPPPAFRQMLSSATAAAAAAA